MDPHPLSHLPQGPRAAVALVLDAFGISPVTAAIVSDGQRTVLFRVGQGWPDSLRVSAAQECWQVLLVQVSSGDGLDWPHWTACVDDLAHTSGATINVVDVLIVAKGSWRSLLCSDAECSCAG